MKKVFTTMAAVSSTLMMVAAPALADLSPKIEKANASSVVTEAREFNGYESRPTTKASDTPDLNNYWGYTYYGRTQQDANQQFCSVQFQQNSETSVTIYGLFFNYAVEATYNATEQTLTIKSGQEVIPADQWNGEPLNLYVIELSPDSDVETQVDAITFTYVPEGVEFSDGSVDYIGGWAPDNVYKQLTFITPSQLGTNNGYQSSWKYGNFFYRLEDLYPEAGAFTFNESEWTNIGKSNFFDGWFGGAGAAYDPSLTYEVVTYRNNANPGLYLLYQPFGPGSLAAETGFNESPEYMGYLIIDATDPDCVLVRPNVPSGLTCSQILGSSAMLACTSYEGVQYYFDEYTIDEIKDEAEMWGDELSTMSEDGTIVIARCCFGFVPYLEDANSWAGVDEAGNEVAITMRSVIQLPTGAVHGIIDDAASAPVKYYNLQGVEINNPEKGQIVIKTQGNKSQKQILK